MQVVCGPFWDNASCVPPTEAGHEAVFPCMTMFAGSLYSARGETNVSLHTTSALRNMAAQMSQIFPEHTKSVGDQISFCQIMRVGTADGTGRGLSGQTTPPASSWSRNPE